MLKLPALRRAVIALSKNSVAAMTVASATTIIAVIRATPRWLAPA